MRSVGLVLSGGGARGAAHIGVLKALDELKINISAISGVSAGAVIGALYAAGNTPENILKELKEQSYFSIKDIAWLKNGLFTMSGLRKRLKELIKQDDFNCLEIPMFINATNISMGTPVIFSQGALYDAIIASASVPVIFEPVAYKEDLLLDGGILNNLPVEPLIGKYDIIIGSHVNKLQDGVKPIKLDRTSLIDQCFHLVIANSVRERAKQCNFFIEPLLSGFGMFDMERADAIFEAGYKATMEQKDKLSAVLQ